MAEYAAFSVIADAYLADTRHLTTEEHGAYLLLLFEASRRPGCDLPDDDALLARLAGLPMERWLQVKATVMAFWTRDGRRRTFAHRHLLAGRAYLAKKSLSQREKALTRWRKTKKEDAAALPRHCRGIAAEGRSGAASPRPDTGSTATLWNETENDHAAALSPQCSGSASEGPSVIANTRSKTDATATLWNYAEKDHAAAMPRHCRGIAAEGRPDAPRTPSGTDAAASHCNETEKEDAAALLLQCGDDAAEGRPAITNPRSKADSGATCCNGTKKDHAAAMPRHCRGIGIAAGARNGACRTPSETDAAATHWKDTEKYHAAALPQKCGDIGAATGARPDANDAPTDADADANLWNETEKDDAAAFLRQCGGDAHLYNTYTYMSSQHLRASNSVMSVQHLRASHSSCAYGSNADVSLPPKSAPGPTRFAEFWEVYPHRDGKRGRKPAEAKYAAAVRRGVPEQTIIDGAIRARSDPRVIRGFARDPATWLNQMGWEDEPPDPAARPPARPPVFVPKFDLDKFQEPDP
jgi:uncharacterized protein YdaU (DUF1376 family)